MKTCDLMKRKFRFLVLTLTSILLIAMCSDPVAWGLTATESSQISIKELEGMIKETGSYLLKTVPEPTLSSVGGEWTILGLSGGNVSMPKEYSEKYVKRIHNLMKDQQGVLTTTKFTEYSRLILAFTSLGEDVTEVGGFNLLDYIADLEQITRQGVNGPAFALLALDSHGYGLPKERVELIKEKGGTVATRENLIAYLVDRGPQEQDPDRTAMMLQALAPYQKDKEVARFGKEAFNLLEKMEGKDGQYYFQGEATSESVIQVMIAKQEWSIPWEKNYEGLKKFRLKDGSYQHVIGEGSDLMATEQAFCALVNSYNTVTQKPGIYDMKSVPLRKDITVSLNGVTLVFDQKPILENDRVLVPLRGILEALGAKLDYEASTGKVTGVWDGHEAILHIGSKIAKVDGKRVTLDVAAKIEGGRTLVPVRFISESLKGFRGLGRAWKTGGDK